MSVTREVSGSHSTLAGPTLPAKALYVTVHEKTKHIAQKMILELRVPWPFMMLEVPMVQV